VIEGYKKGKENPAGGLLQIEKQGRENPGKFPKFQKVGTETAIQLEGEGRREEQERSSSLF